MAATCRDTPTRQAHTLTRHAKSRVCPNQATVDPIPCAGGQREREDGRHAASEKAETWVLSGTETLLSCIAVLGEVGVGFARIKTPFWLGHPQHNLTEESTVPTAGGAHE